MPNLWDWLFNDVDWSSVSWQKVIEFLKAQGKRAAWVETEFGKFPAIAPDLSEWKREIQEVVESEHELQQVVEKVVDVITQPHKQAESVLQEPTGQALQQDAAPIPDEKRYTPLQLDLVQLIS